MSQEHKQSHNRQIIGKQKHKRLSVIKKYKLSLKRHITADIPPYEADGSICGYQNGQDTQHCSTDSGTAPARIQRMMQEKQKQHGGAHPFMKGVPQYVMRHQKQQRNGQQQIHQDLKNGLFGMFRTTF